MEAVTAQWAWGPLAMAARLMLAGTWRVSCFFAPFPQIPQVCEAVRPDRFRMIGR
ncbi:hypothetical protein ABH941_006412 [Streptacidiphilus sp. EB103A]